MNRALHNHEMVNSEFLRKKDASPAYISLNAIKFLEHPLRVQSHLQLFELLQLCELIIE